MSASGSRLATRPVSVRRRPACHRPRGPGDYAPPRQPPGISVDGREARSDHRHADEIPGAQDLVENHHAQENRAGGLTPREAFPLVRRLCAESNVVGFELVELNPLVDPTCVSAMNANRIVRDCLTGAAMRKMGLTDKHYLSPLSTDHGQRK